MPATLDWQISNHCSENHPADTTLRKEIKNGMSDGKSWREYNIMLWEMFNANNQ